MNNIAGKYAFNHSSESTENDVYCASLCGNKEFVTALVLPSVQVHVYIPGDEFHRTRTAGPCLNTPMTSIKAPAFLY